MGGRSVCRVAPECATRGRLRGGSRCSSSYSGDKRSDEHQRDDRNNDCAKGPHAEYAKEATLVCVFDVAAGGTCGLGVLIDTDEGTLPPDEVGQRTWRLLEKVFRST